MNSEREDEKEKNVRVQKKRTGCVKNRDARQE